MLANLVRSTIRRNQSARSMMAARANLFSTEAVNAEDDKNDNPFSGEPSGELDLSPNVKEILEGICKLNMMEVCELSSALQERFNIPDGAGMMGAGAGPAAAADEPKEEKTAFDVKLASFDAKSKIKIIKEVRAITGLGLKEAKALVEATPSVLKKDMKKEDAEEIVNKLKELGGVVELE